MTEADRLMTVQELADFCDVTTDTVYRWNSQGTGPKITRLNRRTVRYRVADVQEWLADKGDTPPAA